MNKKFIGVAALLTAASMLASCGKNSEKVAKEAVTATVDGYMSALMSGDNETAAQFVSGEDVVGEMENKLDIAGVLTGAFGDMTDILPADAVKNISSAVMSSISDNISYKIDSVDLEEDGVADVNMSITIPDFSDVDVSDEKLDAIAGEVLGVDINDTEQLVNLITEKTGMSAEELMAKFADVNENDLIQQVYSAFEPEVIELIKRIITDNSDAIKTVTENADIKLQKQDDGSWKIADLED